MGILRLSRKVNTGIILRDTAHNYSISISINRIKTGNVELGIDAPESVTITKQDYMVMDHLRNGDSMCQDTIS